MQAQTMQSKKSNGKGRVVLSLLLALALGVGGYFGVTMIMTGESPIKSDNHVPKSDIPVDENGDNLIGNSMQNLHLGGFMVMQGEDIFYVNFADGGSLYCRSRNGEITKLTDFAVANLNVRGEMLVFTDLDACSVLGEDGSMATLSAATHEELWDQMGENDDIRYGGHLYFITGIKSFCEGKIAYEDLIIAGVESEERYQIPVFLENGDIVLVAASPGSSIMPTSAFDIAPTFVPLAAAADAPIFQPVKAATVEYTPDSVVIINPDGATVRVNLSGAQGDLIQNVVAAGDKVFVETVNIINGSRMGTTITAIDASTGKAVATIPGGSIQSDDKNLFFINNNAIIKCDAQTGKLSLVSGTPCDFSWYELRPNGTVVYETKDTDNKNTLVTMSSVLQKDGTYRTRVGDSKIPFFLRKNLARLAGNSYYTWSSSSNSWVRVDTTIISKTIDFKGKKKTELYDYDKVKMKWSGQRRDKGQNLLYWLQPGELGELFTDANKPAGTPGASQGAPAQDPDVANQPDPVPDAPEQAPAEPEQAPAAPAPQSGGDLSGTYVSGDNSRHTLTFSSNGTVELFYAGASVTFDYTVSGSTITFTPQGTPAGANAQVASLFTSGTINADGSIVVDGETYTK